MDNIVEMKNLLVEASELGALAALKLQNPVSDELSKNGAYEFAGSRKWLDGHIRAGHIRPYRRGVHKNSPLLFSRMEIIALKKAEREMKFNSEAARIHKREK